MNNLKELKPITGAALVAKVAPAAVSVVEPISIRATTGRARSVASNEIRRRNTEISQDFDPATTGCRTNIFEVHSAYGIISSA
jgi:hypothetical protein